MKALNNKEMELKFSAKEISLEDFTAFAEARKPLKSIYVCGFDTFFSNPKDDTMFLRHRTGDNFNQFTVKRKLVEKNNFIRDEINLTLGEGTSQDTVAAVAKAMGYEFNRTIFKTVFVHNYDKYVLAYYTVYDLNLKELGRFLEIEMAEEYHWETEAQAWALLGEIEASAKVLGVTPQGRIKKSLYEQFRKELK